ncbi:MAG: STAS/SEC14 domain-containing protein [Acidobacteria bacterium]|nr:STAS/SEC14 domain-containing protein [Acidobacteriota bacterium]
MIEILELSDIVVGMRLSGSITADDVEKAYKVTEEALEKHERVSLYAEVDASTALTFEGILKDLVNIPGQLGKLSRYYRAAVVTDLKWIATAARFEGLVFSSIDVRVFAMSDREKAITWVSEKPEPLPVPEEPAPSVRFLATDNDNVFAYEIDGRLREKDTKEIVARFAPFLERDGKVNVLGRFKNFNGFDLMSVFDDDLIKLKYKSTAKVERYAVIGVKPWMRNFLELVDPLINTEIRLFDPSEEKAAWEWVGASETGTADKGPSDTETVAGAA